MWKAKVKAKGQITIPQELRLKIGLEPGDILEFREIAVFCLCLFEHL